MMPASQEVADGNNPAEQSIVASNVVENVGRTKHQCNSNHTLLFTVKVFQSRNNLDSSMMNSLDVKDPKINPICDAKGILSGLNDLIISRSPHSSEIPGN